jgi:asparagine synthase (glutamine-hydrolysing)
MCGIWGAFGRALKPAALYMPCVSQLDGRGPEGTRLEEIGPEAYLGFTRLAINGLTTAGMQPMLRDGVWSATNGEIYNWRDLVRVHGLTGLTTGSDCEVVGALYTRLVSRATEDEIIPALSKLFAAFDGVFATILIDTKLDWVIVARDPYGVRPLFEAEDASGNFFFASEMKALPGACFTVRPVEPGTYSIYDLNTGYLIKRVRYHTTEAFKMPVFESITVAKQAVRESLEAAVRKRMMTERPVAALLSGGLDSSLIAALVAKEMWLAGIKAPLRTFSIGMEGSEDLRHARAVAKWIGSDHSEVVVTADEMWRAVPEVVRDIESFDTTTVRASVGNWLVAREVARRCDCKVVFNGDGSDEVFGSYLYFNSAPSEAAYEEEVLRLLGQIHTFDVLRSDRCISSHGLEPRTPFLDKTFVATVMALPLWMRRPVKGERIEKWILRLAFDDGYTLPKEVLWRKKEAFSDGVSGAAKSWYEITQEKAAAMVPLNWRSAVPLMWDRLLPTTSEMYYYRELFEHKYPGWSEAVVPHFWMPRWSPGATDPSARTLSVYK